LGDQEKISKCLFLLDCWLQVTNMKQESKVIENQNVSVNVFFRRLFIARQELGKVNVWKCLSNLTVFGYSKEEEECTYQWWFWLVLSRNMVTLAEAGVEVTYFLW